MTDLTEQWKKRTLKNGAYYIKLLGGEVLPAFCNTDYILKQFQTMKGIYDTAVAEVLAPVPTYSEYLAVAKQLEIAVEMLKYYGNEDKWTDCHSNWADCDTLSCLCDYGYKFAQEALKQIEELDR